MTPTPPRSGRRAAHVAVLALYVAWVATLAGGAVAIRQLRCENFGCMGLGVAWFAWAVACALGVLPGWFAGRGARSHRRLAAAWRVTAGAHLLLALGAAVAWAAA